MEELNISISNIKNIKQTTFSIPLKNGIYAFVGENGSGKSTILAAMSIMLYKTKPDRLFKDSECNDSSCIRYSIGDNISEWTRKNGSWRYITKGDRILFNGMYERSFFYGTRFTDSTRIDSLLKNGKIRDVEIVDADDYMKDQLSYVLRGDRSHYRSLKKIKNTNIAKSNGLANTPYFVFINEQLISQYNMSSGECLLISLLHFIYNSIVRRSLSPKEKILVFIDEIELALHPIAVKRLLELLLNLTKEHKNLIIIISTHSPEVIKNIHHRNLYRVEDNSGEINVENNCYPSYIIRDVYTQDGFDFLILTEDNLTKLVIENILNKNELRNGKLIHVVPVGGWQNVLALHKDILSNNIVGIGTTVISVLDGDIDDAAINKKYQDLKKLKIPVQSIEKFLFEKCVLAPDKTIKKRINDKYFTLNSIDSLVNDFKNQNKDWNKENKNKNFYKILLNDLNKRQISEEKFIMNLSDDLVNIVNFSEFTESLKRILIL